MVLVTPNHNSALQRFSHLAISHQVPVFDGYNNFDTGSGRFSNTINDIVYSYHAFTCTPSPILVSTNSQSDISIIWLFINFHH